MFSEGDCAPQAIAVPTCKNRCNFGQRRAASANAIEALTLIGQIFGLLPKEVTTAQLMTLMASRNCTSPMKDSRCEISLSKKCTGFSKAIFCSDTLNDCRRCAIRDIASAVIDALTSNNTSSMRPCSNSCATTAPPRKPVEPVINIRVITDSLRCQVNSEAHHGCAGAGFYQITNHPRFQTSQSALEFARLISRYHKTLRKIKQENAMRRRWFPTGSRCLMQNSDLVDTDLALQLLKFCQRARLHASMTLKTVEQIEHFFRPLLKYARCG